MEAKQNPSHRTLRTGAETIEIFVCLFVSYPFKKAEKIISVPHLHGQIRGKCGLIESLHLSNKIRRPSDSLVVIVLGSEDVDKSGKSDKLNTL